jgi:DNA invertase Pin-like site-specific DNA recombinase
MDAIEIVESARNVYSKEMYAMYLRKSRTDLELEALGEGETLARHKAMLEALAAKHNISSSQIVIYEELVSGDSIDERPEMQRLLSDVYAGKYKGVLVVEVERLARGNTKDQGEVADAFQFSNTHIITPAKVYDPNNEFDQEYFEFGLFMSRREYKTIKRRLEAGKLQSVKEGNYLLSVPPYGFDILKKSKKERTLIEKPEESKIIKMIYDWYTEDRKPTSWIAKQLNLMGVPSRSGREWARATIKDILFNAHYIGKVSWGKQQTVKEKDPITGKVIKKRKYTGNEQFYEGKHKGFISEEQFYKVRTIYGTQAPAKLNTELVNPLSGILRCCDCDRAIGFQQYGDSRIPRFQHPFGKACKKNSIQQPVVMNALIEALKKNLADCEIKMEAKEDNSELLRHTALLQTMEAELAKLEGRKRKLMDSWEAEDGMYTRDEFIERKQMYNQSIEALKTKIAEAKKNAPAPVDYSEQITMLHAIMDCINNEDIDAKSKNVFLKQFIEKITYDTIDNGVNKKVPVLEVFLK